MCPLSVALPPPAVDTDDSWYYPMRAAGAVPFSAMNFGANANQRSQTIGATNAFGTYGASGGGGSLTELAGGAGAGQPGGRQESVQVTTTVAGTGGGVKPPMPKESYGPAADWAAGALQIPSAVVSVYGVTFQTSTLLAAWPDDTTGFAFTTNTGVMADSMRPGSAPTSGFGMFLNDDGAGNAELEFVSWIGAATQERIPLTAGIITDLTLWNSMRFVIVSAADGREAQLTVSVNSTPFLVRNFGGGAAPDVPRPAQGAAAALHYVFCNVALLGGGDSYSFMAYGYDGRFNPAGQELQPFGA